MAVRHDKYGVQIDSTLLGGITQQDLVANSELRGEATSGSVHPLLMSLTAQNPTGNFATLAVQTALGLVDADSLAIPCTTLNFYAQKYAAGGTRESGATHKKYTMALVLIAPQTLTCEHQGDASLSCQVAVGYDGTNEPIVPTESQSLPAGLTDTVRHTLGKMTIGGVLLDSKVGFTLNFGLQVEAIGVNSDVWPTEISIVRQALSITLRGIDPGWFKASGAVPLTGAAAGHANTSIYLRKRSTGGTFVADETAEHIKLTACGMIAPQTILQAGDGAAETELTMPLYHDGTNMPLIIDTTSAIT